MSIHGNTADPPVAPVAAPADTRILVRRSTSERRSTLGEIALAAREVWQSQELVQQLVMRDVRVRYHQAVMGFAWALFMPMLIVLSGTLVRLAMATVSGSALAPQVLGATAVKGLAWAFFAGALGTATQSLLANSALITKLYFPREVLPLSSVLAQTFDTAIGAAAVAVLLPFLGLTISPALLWVPLLVVLLFMITLVAALVTSCANLFFRDVKYIVQVLLTFGIFLTPVFFEPAMLGPVAGPIMMLNPVSPLIEGLRLTVIEGHGLLAPLVVTTGHGAKVVGWTPWYLAYSAVWAVAGLVVSMRIFRRAAVVFAEYA
ncbi:MAG TPA: ABC transporter permease [Gemmatimonadaceae bacterium]|nr:ABC transporter permease [Gemmatimonadaceae bacterium]